MERTETSDQILNWLNKHLKFLSFVFLLIILGIIGAYVLQFYNHKFSTSTEHWGQLGDYIGGLLNPIIAICNLVFLMYLTLLLKNRDDKADNKAIYLQKYIALNQFRHDAFNKLKDHLEHFDEFPDTFTEMIKSYSYLGEYISKFEYHYGYLFDNEDFRQSITNLCNSIDEITINIIKHSNVIEEPIDYLTNADNIANEFDECFQDFLIQKDVIISVMQHIILDKEYKHI